MLVLYSHLRWNPLDVLVLYIYFYNLSPGFDSGSYTLVFLMADLFLFVGTMWINIRERARLKRVSPKYLILV